MTPHKAKAGIEIRVYFDPIWLKGFCYGTGRTETGLFRDIRDNVLDHCKELTSCRFLVKTKKCGYLKNRTWSVLTEFEGSVAPKNCAVRKLEYEATAVTRRILVSAVPA